MIEARYFIPFGKRHEAKNKVGFSNPLEIDEDEEKWREIDNNLQEEARKMDKRNVLEKVFTAFLSKFDQDNPSQQPLEWKESSKKLVEGFINLINALVAKSKEGRPISTLVFLDKSARLAAYLFRKIWQELELNGKLPKGVLIPKIRFINVGKDQNVKLNLKKPKELFVQNVAKKKHYHDPEEGDVMVVDEAIVSGSSVVNVSNFLHQHFGYEPDSISFLNSELPAWYTQEKIKGVDNVDVEKQEFEFFDTLDDSSFALLKKITDLTRKKPNDREALISAGLESNVSVYYEFFQKNDFTNVFSDQEIVQLFEVLSNLDMPASHITDYFDSEGGFLAMKVRDKRARRRNRDFRFLLKKLAQQSVKHLHLHETTEQVTIQ